jgi:UDP-N-acetylmuramoyl-L-alanyl-D-glutamate--2,6-diaminopimelate ligase
VSTAVRLAEVTQRLQSANLLVHAPAEDPLLSGVADDSRKVQQGDLFCAWQGTTYDSHAALPDAQRKGAAAALVEQPAAQLALPQVQVTDGRRAAAIGASLVLGDPQNQLRVAGITGTNGKTTSVWILRHILSLHYPTASLGTLGVILEDGSTLPGSGSLTTPGPVDLARTLRLLVERGVRAIAMETSSHALHQGRVAALRFDAAVFTNLSRDHLDYHGTLEAYLAAKLSLCEQIKADGWAVTNTDDPAWADVPARVTHVLRFGLSETADVRAERITLGAQGAEFDLIYRDTTAPVTLPLPGGFNVHNALGAAAAAFALDFHPAEVAARLATVPQVPGRLERIADAPCPVLRDYAHTPDALERALAALRPLVAGRLIVVFGAGGDRDRGKRPLMGAVAARAADVPIVTSDNPRTEEPDAIIDEIVAGMPGQPVRITDRRRAIAHALSMAHPDDLILLAGKGHETYQIVGHETLPFDERIVVNQLLAEQGPRR